MITKAELKRRVVAAEEMLEVVATRLHRHTHTGLTGAECHKLSVHAHEILANNRKEEES